MPALELDSGHHQIALRYQLAGHGTVALLRSQDIRYKLQPEGGLRQVTHIVVTQAGPVNGFRGKRTPSQDLGVARQGLLRGSAVVPIMALAQEIRSGVRHEKIVQRATLTGALRAQPAGHDIPEQASG